MLKARLDFSDCPQQLPQCVLHAQNADPKVTVVPPADAAGVSAFCARRTFHPHSQGVSLLSRSPCLGRISLRPTFFPAWSSARRTADACTPTHLGAGLRGGALHVAVQRWPSCTAWRSMGAAEPGRWSRGAAVETASASA
jgi:hypothetical protein